MRTIRLAGVVATLALFLAAGTASAQETQEDLGTRIVREQEDIRRRALDKVLGAPGRALDHSSADPFTAIGSEPAQAPAPASQAKAPPAQRTKTPREQFPWVVAICVVPVIAMCVLAVMALRGNRSR